MLVFLSYSTKDKLVAAEIAKFFNDLQIDTFMAHEDIDVSQRWQNAIIENLDEADIFVAVLSASYLRSDYCLQESGIAVFNEDELVIIPLTIDGSNPPGFMKHIQAKYFPPGEKNAALLWAAMFNCDFDYTVDLLVNRLGKAGSWERAQHWFSFLESYLLHLTKRQSLDVLGAAAENNQFAGSYACGNGLRTLFEKHGKFLDRQQHSYLKRVLY